MNDQIKNMNSGEQHIADWQKNATLLEEGHAYNPADEIGSCGVGMVTAIDGAPRRSVVEAGIAALKVLWHRGAVDADGKTGDGAGIRVQVPQPFFSEAVKATGHKADDSLIAVGQIFLPRTDFGAQEAARTIVEKEIIDFGYYIYGWRQVPVDISVIGEKANATRPEIEQIMVSNNKGVDEDQFERDLYVIRRRIEKAALSANLRDFYVCSLSCQSIIYKGMFLAEQLDTFYPDLQDERFVSNFAVYHQRYSTNTFPQWWLAQPFRMLAHNGEINTLRGNENWMKSHEIRMASEAFGDHSEDIKPIIAQGSSDSAALDSVFEVMVRAGRPAPVVKTMLIPEAAKGNKLVPDHHRRMYEYVYAVMEPWDGPAAICAVDGHWAIAGLDRNGLRPLRYSVTDDGLLIVGSETGMVRIPEANIVEKGRVGPGEMIAVNLDTGDFLNDRATKDYVAGTADFENLTKNIKTFQDIATGKLDESACLTAGDLRRRQVASGFSIEDLETVIHPMIIDAKEPIGSMGDDTPLAVLSGRYRGLHHFFRQNFSQVTNPPIDPLREQRVMSLKTRFSNLINVLDENGLDEEVLVMDSPVITNGEYRALVSHFGEQVKEIDCTFPADGSDRALTQALERIQQEAEDAVRSGFTQLILTDEHASAQRAMVPMILATGAAHTHLVKNGLRTFTSLNVRSAECIDTHYFAVLIGVGATTVNAWLAQDSIVQRHEKGLFGDMSLDQALENFKEAIDQGLLKIMSKMGIAVIASYRGGYNFEALGLSRALVADLFPGMPSRLSGIGTAGIEKKVLELNEIAFDEDAVALPIGGLYKLRANGETHGWDGKLLHQMQKACDTGRYMEWKKFSEGMQNLPPVALRDLLGFKNAGPEVSVDEVESITAIRKTFLTPGMSLGALSPEAHGTLNIAMNRIGAKSVSGEGGEDRERYTPRPNGDNANSYIKQVASGRFGVNAEYLNQCKEIEIKVAQGAKPGEGGQLPGFKVTLEIAKLRNSTPGVTLISPPPHHDIYSIEDLAQLIYDLKQINPDAKVCVKLVARSGIGTIAAGVAKANADVILVSGFNGGTGASPLTSIKYAGLPWEMGLSEVHQVLTMNRLRSRVVLRTDGGIKTGRDIVMAAMLGAEEYGIGTASLIAMGCIMVRQCQANTCPVGVCTQREDLRDKFTGTADKVVNMFTLMAEEVREILASLGVRSLKEIIGRTDLLHQVSRGAAHLDDLDMNPLLVKPDPGDLAPYCTLEGRNPVPDTLDAQIIKDADPLFSDGEKMQLTYTVRNTHRAVGTRTSAMITRKFGMSALAEDHLTIRLRGSAGQSLGAFLVRGVKLEVLGDANDYVGKGLSGGTIVVRPQSSSPLVTNQNAIIGNTVLYGATAGKLFAAGQAGERFAVRNSGAHVVVEGVGANGCEYMTGGMATILGPVGENFGAGMSGGMAFVYDETDTFEARVNDDMIVYQRLASTHWEAELKAQIEAHVAATGSLHAEELLRSWNHVRDKFWHICPKEMLNRIDHPMSDDAPANENKTA